MAKYQIKEINDQKIWEDFLAKHEEANFLQSWYWGQFNQVLGSKTQTVGIYQDNELKGVMLSIVEDAKRGRYLTIPAGPIIDWNDPDIIISFVDLAKTFAKEKGCVFIRVRPQLIADEFSKELFKKLGFSDAPMHLHAELTLQIDITKPEEELLAQMRKTTRYEIRQAINKGVTVKTSADPADIKGFYELQLETAKRQGFIPFPYNYLHEQFKIFASENKALLFSAYHEKKLLAQAFIIFYGIEAAYHYGVSTEAGRDYPGAYLIQWEAIKEAQRRGLKRYNLWGIAPLDNPKHRFYRISIFKRGFGGQEVQYLHAQDLPINKPLYFLNFAIESLRKKTRNL